MHSHALTQALVLLTGYTHLSHGLPPSFSRIEARQGPTLYKEYTAIGDSYGSGVGAGAAAPQDTGHTDCHRRVGSYPYLFSEANSGMKFNFNACSGFQVLDTLKVQVNDDNSAFGNPDVVSISAGGNAGAAFYRIAKFCSYGTGLDIQNCKDARNNAETVYKGIVPDMKALILGAMRKNAIDGRKVAVLGYPALYNDQSYKPVSCIAADIRQDINRISMILYDNLKEAVKQANCDKDRGNANAIFVDTNPQFDGHRFCEDDESGQWFIGGPGAKDNQEPWNDPAIAYFHPNTDGQKSFLGALEDALNNAATANTGNPCAVQ